MDLDQENLPPPTATFMDVTEKIIGCAFTIMNDLGSGFLEKVYENALVVELRQKGLQVIQQKQIEIRYRNIIGGGIFCRFSRGR
jgi:GxxExxY protein